VLPGQARNNCARGRRHARPLLVEVLGFRPDIIEHQLAHAVKDPNGRAYNRTTHIVERTRMMQEWANYLTDLRISTHLTGNKAGGTSLSEAFPGRPDTGAH